MNSINLLLEASQQSLLPEQSSSATHRHMSTAHSAEGQRPPPSFPGPLGRSTSTAYLRASSAPSSIISNSRSSSRRRSSAASSKSNYSNSNSSLPTTIFTVSSSNPSLGAHTSSPSRQSGRDSRWAGTCTRDAVRRADRKINAAIARTIASDSQSYTTQLVDEPRRFQKFQAKLIQSGTVTNLAAREVLREDVMRSKCYLSQKHELQSRHEAEVEAAANQAGGGAVRGMKRVLSSAFSLDTLAGLEMECSTSNFGNIDLAEQHAIMSEIMASRNGRQEASLAASRRRSSAATTVSGGAGSGAFHDSCAAADLYSSQASDLSAAVPTAAQVLANSLGNQVKRISMSLSSVAAAKPSPYDGSSSTGISYNRSSSIPSMITSSTAPSSTYTGHSSYQRCSSLSHASRRSSVESIGSRNACTAGGAPPTGTIYEMNLNDLKNIDSGAKSTVGGDEGTDDNMSASTLKTDQTPQRRGSRRLSDLRMSFLAFDDVFHEDLHEVSDEDQSTSGSEHGNNTTAGSANTSSKSFDHAQHEMDTIALQDQVLAAKLQSAEIQEELLCAWPHQMSASRRRASMASDASFLAEYEQDVKKSADEELNAQTSEMRRQFYRSMSNHRLSRMGSDRKLSAKGKKKYEDKGQDGQDFNESFSTIKKARAA